MTFLRHTREGGYPDSLKAFQPVSLDSRLRGNDGREVVQCVKSLRGSVAALAHALVGFRTVAGDRRLRGWLCLGRCLRLLDSDEPSVFQLGSSMAMISLDESTYR